jgi:hypothetical protein
MNDYKKEIMSYSLGSILSVGLLFGLANWGHRCSSDSSTRTHAHTMIPDSLRPDTVYVENIFGMYDAQLIKYKARLPYNGHSTLILGVFEGTPFYSGEHDLILANDLNNQGEIDDWVYYPKGWQSGTKEGELKAYANKNTLSGLEKELLLKIK